MIEIKEKRDCCGCYSCINACPIKCISMNEDHEGFVYPTINKDKCINCGLCDKVCPIKSTPEISKKIVGAYAAYSKDEAIRLSSSSGGLFRLFAEQIINQGGSVFGAAFDENFGVNHVQVNNIEKLINLQGSKYVQSNINNTYSDIKELLDNNKSVYFSGTPCQVEGLYTYLGKDYDKLITQDILCHGVPSHILFNKFLTENSDGKIKNINFRDKSSGWQGYSVLINSDIKYIKSSNTCSFIKAFVNGYGLRPSCYECKFKKKNRISDITLGDLWGADNIVPDLNDNKGLSLVVINSANGKNLFNCIVDSIVFREISLENALKYNKSYSFSSSLPQDRDEFIRDLSQSKLDDLLSKKYCKKTLLSQLKFFIKRIINH